eukprot:TRINITY_DN2477_c0_g1_i38.p3 TRINITY_DN2477_c0_g1~~TRINITY_DN2477_c0_g1_i38.p3  ORF type:complete len:113 (+),score=8.64 TRINITY_DN2477_c0_g1_i38:224-562(+)
MDAKKDTREGQEGRNPKPDEESSQVSEAADDMPNTNEEQPKNTNRRVRAERSRTQSTRRRRKPARRTMSRVAFQLLLLAGHDGRLHPLCALQYPANVYYEMLNILTSAYSQR